MSFLIVNDLSLSVSDQDHTLINPLKHMISAYSPDLDFCGYTIAHPSEKRVNIVVQYKEEEKQTVENVIKKIEEGIDNLQGVIQTIYNKL
ncbi:DNA-directed RNA polymerases I and III subunit RPAC2 [Vairimorpha necatrix]|uniref:DNA-directed RNA polymerases I and III subunit RPAC2 n=1 Tax=Vairimorpha necatrix TaxID=6039 RepID=A0AAX4JIN6_9MICR